MATPIIYFNSSTGSDTAASGSGGTAVTAGGNNSAATTAASNVVALIADNPSLAGVSTAGDAVMWVDATTGREFSVITAVDDTLKTVTCVDNFANTEGSRNWGIGGKRATLDNASSRLALRLDPGPGWIFEIETNQTITSGFGTLVDNNTGLAILLRGAAGSTPIINCTANAQMWQYQDGWYTKNLQFTNSNAAHARPFSGGGSSGAITFEACIFGDATNTIASAIDRASSNSPVIFIDCEFKNCTSGAIASTVTTIASLIFDGCWIHDCGGAGISANATVIVLDNCIIEDNAGDGIAISGTNTTGLFISDCVIDGNGGDGIDLATAGGVITAHSTVIANTNITANGGYGVNLTSGASLGYEDYNNFGTGATANASGSLNTGSIGSHSLTVDPQYINPAVNNFGGGANVKTKGFPDATRTVGDNKSGTTAYVDIGIQQQATGGGSFTFAG